MSLRPKGKHVFIDANNPEGLGICDKTGFVFKRRDLVKQMEWRGNSLVWTGFYVGRPYVDVPNEQGRPPKIYPDPVPLKDPRLPQGQLETFSNNGMPVFSEMYVPLNTVGSDSDGCMAPDVNARLTNLEDDVIPNLSVTNSLEPETAPVPYTTALSNLQNFNWTTGEVQT